MRARIIPAILALAASGGILAGSVAMAAAPAATGTAASSQPNLYYHT
jgi:hypothetical protein